MKLSKFRETTRIQTLVIGGGQAGLSVGYFLAGRQLPFLVLDAHSHVGDAWRNRWDSLRLFTPARYAGLPGMRFPLRGDLTPTKDQVADYLADYAQRFRIPVLNGVKVDRLWKEGERFFAKAGERIFESQNVVVAMSNYQVPRVPAFADQLSPTVTQLHSHHYRNPSQLQPGSVLVVGVGNSGADIAMEVARTHPTWLGGQESGHIPLPIDSLLSRFLVVRVVRFIGHHVLTTSTPIGRKARPKLLHRAAPLVRVKPHDLLSAGVQRVPRATGTKNGMPLLADHRTLEVNNVIWCTGYEHGFPWIDLPILGQDGELMHERGVVPSVPGLYFVGLHFLHAMSSATLLGIGRDTEHVVNALAVRTGKLKRPLREEYEMRDDISTRSIDSMQESRIA